MAAVLDHDLHIRWIALGVKYAFDRDVAAVTGSFERVIKKIVEGLLQSCPRQLKRRGPPCRILL